MSKKRKSLATKLDEVDRSMYSTFCNAANSLSQLYSQASSHHKLSFLSGERHALEKLFQWISKQHGEGLTLTSHHILAYIQAELECSVEDPSMTPRSLQQVTSPFTNSGSSSDHLQQQQPPRNYIFSNALSSPVRQNYQQGYGLKNNNDQHHQTNDNFDSSSMDINAAGHD